MFERIIIYQTIDRYSDYGFRYAVCETKKGVNFIMKSTPFF